MVVLTLNLSAFSSSLLHSGATPQPPAPSARLLCFALVIVAAIVIVVDVDADADTNADANANANANANASADANANALCCFRLVWRTRKLRANLVVWKRRRNNKQSGRDGAARKAAPRLRAITGSQTSSAFGSPDFN